MAYLPGETVTIQRTTQTVGGVLTDADATPTGVLVRNGADTGETVTVQKVSTGTYSLAWTIPAGWSTGDTVEVRMAATVGGVSGAAVVWSERLGGVQLDPSQVLSQSPTTGTLGHALLMALAVGAYKITVSDTTLTLYKADGTTALATFTLNSATAPTARSPA